MRNLTRALAVLKRGGPRILLRRLIRRFIYRHWRVRVFRDPATMQRTASVWPNGYRFELRPRSMEVPPEWLEVMRRAGANVLFADLDHSDYYYLVWHGESLAAFGAVFVRSPQRDVLGLPADAVLIGACETVKAHRNRGLYRLALNDTARFLRTLGYSQVYIEVEDSNTPSIQGIVGAAFIEDKPVDAHIWFGVWLLRDKRLTRIRRAKVIS